MKPILPALLGMMIVATPALAISPNVRGISPVGGQRGTEVVVTLTGQRLSDIKEILFYQPGVTVSKIEVDKTGQVKATFKVAADAPLGLHDFRVRTATGVSALKTFSVGALRDVKEVEPNNDFAKPQPIDMNVTVNGIADNEDIDYYAVQAKKGERITVEVEGIRLGLSLFDPYVAILDAKRFELEIERRFGASSGRMGSFRSSRRRTALTSSSCAKARIAATRRVFIGCTSATSPGRPRPFRPAARSVSR